MKVNLTVWETLTLVVFSWFEALLDVVDLKEIIFKDLLKHAEFLYQIGNNMQYNITFQYFTWYINIV